MESFTFDVDDDQVVAALHLPSGSPARGSVVVTGPLTSVKEQAAGTYAAAMAARGYAALAFDPRNFGESGGQPRQLFDPEQTIVDIYHAVTALLARAGSEDLPVFGLGVCLGAGPMAVAAARDGRFAGFASVAGGFVDDDRMRAMLGDSFAAMVERGREAERDWSTRGFSATIPAVGPEGGDVAMPLREAYEYYGTPRGGVPTYRNEYAVASFAHQLPFTCQPAASRMTVPFLLVHSENAVLVEEARQFYDAVASRKQDVWLHSAGQVDFYDEPVLVAQAADAVATSFDMVLTERAAAGSA